MITGLAVPDATVALATLMVEPACTAVGVTVTLLTDSGTVTV